MEPYSDILPPETGSIVKRIAAISGHKSFGTMKFSEHTGGQACWLEARSNGDNTWRVEKITTVPAALCEGANGRAQEKTEMYLDGICFFDALHACAFFERQMKEGGASGEDSGNIHFRDVARANKIPFDTQENLPVPAADGRILGTGVFPAEERRAAYETAGNLADVPVKPMLPALLKGLNPPALPVRNGDALEAFDRVLIRGQFVEEAAGKAGRLGRAFEKARKCEFLKVGDATFFRAAVAGASTSLLGASNLAFLGAGSSIGAVAALSMLTTLGLGVVGGLGAAIYVMSLMDPPDSLKGKNGFPRRQFKNQLAAMRNYSASLADENLKAAFNQVASDMEVGFYALCARESYRRAEKYSGFGKSYVLRRFKSDIKAFVDIAEKNGYKKTEIDNFLDLIRQAPQSKTFDDELAQKMKDRIRQFESFLRGLTPDQIGAKPYKEVTHLLVGRPFP